MMLVPLVSWWYTAGWARLAVRVGSRANGVLETFSVSLLLRTLFAPFKQISASAGTGKSMNDQMRAMGDRLFSRFFGVLIRSVFILIGTVGAFLALVVGLVQLLIWPLIPVLPIIGIVLYATGAVL